ncbi:MAG: cobyrinate a,c-diamide synthase [Deltaproteobacteria bacterium]|jgi:cobyrinic acid a,c-diamide synthase|nr:cobyrinate a,c-diamide synthase [Deltaproteobacteria bacterium]
MALNLTQVRRCPAILLAAPASGQGKTTLTAALARYHANLGRRVRIFKCGPDFLDPMILERASGCPVYQLDLWMAGEDLCSELLWQAAGEADLILVEGVMGLFDGRPSAADLARLFQLPVLIVISGAAMAQTFGAVALGLSIYQPDLPVAGFMANRTAGETHARSLAQSLPSGLKWYGHLSRQNGVELPSRHLGLVQAGELADLDSRLDRAAEALAGQPVTSYLPIETDFCRPHLPDIPNLLDGVTVAAARDEAFGFIYPANLDLLRTLGARTVFFSPLAGDGLPEGTDSVYLPGGYPELHLEKLARNRKLKEDLKAHHRSGRPILAECGGFLYLLEELTFDGRTWPQTGLLPGRACLTEGLAGLGLMEAPLPEGSLRGHTFHHSRLETPLKPLVRAVRPGSQSPGEEVYRDGRLTATYVHFYWPSNPEAAAALLRP